MTKKEIRPYLDCSASNGHQETASAHAGMPWSSSASLHSGSKWRCRCCRIQSRTCRADDAKKKETRKCKCFEKEGEVRSIVKENQKWRNPYLLVHVIKLGFDISSGHLFGTHDSAISVDVSRRIITSNFHWRQIVNASRKSFWASSDIRFECCCKRHLWPGLWCTRSCQDSLIVRKARKWTVENASPISKRDIFEKSRHFWKFFHATWKISLPQSHEPTNYSNERFHP